MAISRQRYPPGATEYLLRRHLGTLEQHVAQRLADTASQYSIDLNPQSAESNIPLLPLTSTAPSNPVELPLAPWESFEWMSWDWNDIFPQN